MGTDQAVSTRRSFDVKILMIVEEEAAILRAGPSGIPSPARVALPSMCFGSRDHLLQVLNSCFDSRWRRSAEHLNQALWTATSTIETLAVALHLGAFS